jgi:hypothetical protein
MNVARENPRDETAVYDVSGEVGLEGAAADEDNEGIDVEVVLVGWVRGS